MPASFIDFFTGASRRPFWRVPPRAPSPAVAAEHAAPPTRLVRHAGLGTDAVLRAHAAVASLAYDALIGTTREGIVRSWNHAAERIFGYTAAQAVGRHLSFLAEPGQAESQAELMNGALAGRVAAPLETTRQHRDGPSVPIELNMMPLRNPAGAVVALAALVRDISVRKRADAHRALLAEELAHRAKNTIATVQSIAMHTLRGAVSLDDFKTAFCARLNALSATHSLLTRSGWKSVALTELVKTELAPYLGADPARLVTSGPAVDLDPEQSLALGMALHELATNAVKYGALSVIEGQVHIAWDIDGAEAEARLKLHWRESGGPPVVSQDHRGFGTRLLTQGLAHELGGGVSLAFPPAGAQCEIDVPRRRLPTA